MTMLTARAEGNGAPSLMPTDSLLLRNYAFVKGASPWLTTANAAALTLYSANNIAEAEVGMDYGSGGLTTFGGGDEALGFGAGVEAFYRLTPRMVVHGSMAYDNQTAWGVTGSAFTVNSYQLPVGRTSILQFFNSSILKPFNLLEATDENEGRTHSDTYSLTGGIGYDIGRGYSIGARMDYTAANYAKYKDLRHKNKFMDMNASAGFMAPLAQWLRAGANYTYLRQTESITFSTYGKSDKVYYSLIDYGAMMGMLEQFGSEGYTEKNREMPYLEEGHGGELQFEILPKTSTFQPPLTPPKGENPCRMESSPFGGVRGGFNFSTFISAAYRHSTGHYGRRSDYTIAYTNHDRDLFALRSRLALTSATVRHYLDICYQWEEVKNRAETFRAMTAAETGATYYEYYDAAETGKKRRYTLAIDYTLHWGVRGELPKWTICTGYHRQERHIDAYLYPYYRLQRLTTHEVAAMVERNVLTQRGVWTLTLNGGFLWGNGQPYTDGTFAEPSAAQPEPATMPTFLWQDYHLLTSPQYTIGAQVKYAFHFPATPLLTHVRLGIQQRHANALPQPDCCARNRTTLSLALGCTF